MVNISYENVTRVSRVAVIFFIGMILLGAMTACAEAPTSTMIQRYLYYLGDRYDEKVDGYFLHGHDHIVIVEREDGIEFHPSFTSAIVTVFTDGSLSAIYAGDEHLTCEALVSVDACVATSPNAEIARLEAFREVVILETTVPVDDSPALSADIADRLFVVGLFAMALLVQLAYMFFPFLVQGRFHTSGRMQLGKYVSTAYDRFGGSSATQKYWRDAAGNAQDDREDAGRSSATGSADGAASAPESLEERWKRLRFRLIVTAMLLIGAIVAAIFW